ncbi:MAG: DUF624 domain-containing protein [Chloroflexota bacterium]
MNLRTIVGRAFGLWWDDWVPFIALNAAWLMLQIPIVTGPPATAAVFAMARLTYNGEYWGPREAWAALRASFWPAWRWGLLNGVIVGVAVTNLLVYRQAASPSWQLLRVVWLLTTLAWLSLNLFYWPFWWSQKDQSMRATYSNCGRFVLLHPGLALSLAGFCLLLTLVSILTTLPFTAALTGWLALIGTTAVQESIKRQKAA